MADPIRARSLRTVAWALCLLGGVAVGVSGFSSESNHPTYLPPGLQYIDPSFLAVNECARTHTCQTRASIGPSVGTRFVDRSATGSDQTPCCDFLSTGHSLCMWRLANG